MRMRDAVIGNNCIPIYIIRLSLSGNRISIRIIWLLIAIHTVITIIEYSY